MSMCWRNIRNVNNVYRICLVFTAEKSILSCQVDTYYARSLNNELLDTKCSIKKSLSGTSYLLRKVHAYILIKPFNVYIKTLHANLDNLISLTMLTWDFETRRRKNTCSVFVCPSPVEMQPLKTRWLGPRQTLKELCHDLRMCSLNLTMTVKQSLFFFNVNFHSEIRFEKFIDSLISL